MPLEPAQIAALTLYLSPERLGKLAALTGSAEQAIQLHQETLRLGAALMNVTATIEIALRNAVCENLGQYFAVPNWLIQPPVHFQWRQEERAKITTALDSARRAKYSKLSQAEKAALDALAYPQGRPENTTHLNRAKARRRYIQVTDGKVIAELTLYFWKRLYGPGYEQALWRTTLKKTFPNKKLTRAEVADALEHIYQSRNRLAHHEPVLHKRFDDTMNAIQFVIINLGALAPDPNSPLAILLAGDLKDVMDKAAALHGRLDAFQVDH
jgi:hypothetical protein